jgi:hypothetical protein
MRANEPGDPAPLWDSQLAALQLLKASGRKAKSVTDFKQKEAGSDDLKGCSR